MPRSFFGPNHHQPHVHSLFSTTRLLPLFNTPYLLLLSSQLPNPNMRTTFSAIAALAAVAGAQSTTSIDIDAITVAVPTSVFVLPVVYVTAEGAPTLTATTLATTAIPSSDPKATAVFDSAADVTAAIVSASESAAAVETSIVKRDGSCVQQPLGVNHASLPDTPAAFAADPYYGIQAVNAVLPSGYVQTFSNLTASNSADGYIGFTLMNSYDVATCGSKCLAIDGCNSFNIYFERDPQVDPSVAGCSNPNSTVNVKCVFWQGAVTVDNANNYGQMRDGFQVVVAGSNGYIASAYAAKLAAKATATSSSSSAAASATDAAGNIYTIYYSSDSTQGSYSNAQASSSYTDCMTACDSDSQCNAFTYVGGANGVGSGTCWLKSQLGSPSTAGSNVLSGVRSGKAVSSSSSSTVSTTSSSSSASSSVASTSSSSSFSTTTSSSSSSTSSSTLVTKTSSSTSSSSTVASTSTSSSTSSSVVSTTMSSSSSSSSSSATTMSTVTKPASVTTTSASSISSSSTSTTSSSKTSSAPASATTAFYIAPWDGYYAMVAWGSNAAVSYTNQWMATKFQIDPKTSYLVEASGFYAGYAASMPKGEQVNQKLVFNPTGTASNNYVKCSIDEKAGYLVCSANGQFQQAYACSSDGYSALYFGPSVPSTGGCQWVGLYRQSA
ncbi:hypothetical protein E4T43_02706 [Aureobasidium subglaciale]|nr:hypothetical protein E4T43_02706 [Aureobasidium subglaciale]